MAEIDEAGDAVARVGHAAGHDGVEVGEVGLHVDGDAVERDPAPQPHADGRDLVLEARALVRPGYPNADAILAALPPHVERRQGLDDPLFEAGDIGPHIRPSSFKVEHDVGHALARTMVGELSATPGVEYREARIAQVLGLAAGAG